MVTKRAPPGQEFRLKDGSTVQTITELAQYLQKASDDDYNHHVSSDQNDFAAWIRGVHRKEELADDVEKAGSRQEAVNVLKDAIKEHYGRSSKPLVEPKEPETPLELQRRHGHDPFMHIEFVYGAVFGILMTLIVMGVLSALG